MSQDDVCNKCGQPRAIHYITGHFPPGYLNCLGKAWPDCCVKEDDFSSHSKTRGDVMDSLREAADQVLSVEPTGHAWASEPGRLIPAARKLAKSIPTLAGVLVYSQDGRIPVRLVGPFPDLEAANRWAMGCGRGYQIWQFTDQQGMDEYEREIAARIAERQAHDD